MSLAILWLVIPWAWSPVDDSGLVIQIGEKVDGLGRLSGTFSQLSALYQWDENWGLFRPAYWVYQALFFQLPVSIAHLVRLFMVFAVVLGPVVYFRRSGASSSRLWLTLLITTAAASTLYQGLFLVSLQELSGAAFIGVGLMARRNSTRIAFWLVAALFKAPFAWILIGNSVFLWRQKKHLQAGISGGMGVVVLAASTVWSRNGDYTSRYRMNPLDLGIYENFSRLVEPMNALLLVGLLWWLIVTNSSVKRHEDALLFLVAWVGYTLTMIPWGVTAYYMGPISYLFGIFLASVLVNARNVSGRQVLVALLMPAFVAFWLTRITLNLGFEINSVMLQSKQCIAPLSGSTTVIVGNLLYVTSSPEGAIRIMEQVRMEDPNWSGSVTMENADRSGFLDPDASHYLLIGATSVPEGRSVKKVCSGSAIALYELGPVNRPSTS